MSHLFTPYPLRGVTVPNRAWMSPMCMYSAPATGEHVGRPTDFHLAHYTARALGGVGLVMLEATAVRPEGRISAWDLGLWSDDQIPAFARVAASVKAAGAVIGVQLAHAGRKASTTQAWNGSAALEGDLAWQTVAPSPIAFPGLPAPHELTIGEIAQVVQAFADAAGRALAAGFDVVEIHAAHGYLLNEFLSPAANHRTDGYGGSLENRSRIVLEVIDAVRRVWPSDKPVFLRISTTDWITEDPDTDASGWGLDDSIQLARWAHERGVDLIDASSGGVLPVPIPHTVDYQTALAARLRAESGVPVAAVVRITEPEQAEQLLASGGADAVFLARALLRDLSWANNAAASLGEPRRLILPYGRG